jgi:F420-non-reducing hydrogenase iron-sulfur subunit
MIVCGIFIFSSERFALSLQGRPICEPTMGCLAIGDTPNRSFEPKIIGFLCSYCSYSAADLAGQSQIVIPANLRIIKVPCTGRVDPAFVLRALAAGADGVLICGCHPGDCHYIDGNHKAAGRFLLLRRTVKDLGMEKERIKLAWVGASEAKRLSEIVVEMTEQIRALGPRRSLNKP